MARIVTGGFTTFRLDLHLDPQTLDLYGIADYLKTPGYTGANWKAEVDSSGRWGFGAGGIDTTYRTSITFDGASLNGLVVNDTGAGGTPNLQLWKKNGATVASLDYTGALLVYGSGAYGYTTGSGGTVTQATSKTTGVTLNKTNGQITMNGAALGATTRVAFLFTNSKITAPDELSVWVASGVASGTTYRVWVGAVSAGAATIVLENYSGGSLSEAVVLGFAVRKAATS